MHDFHGTFNDLLHAANLRHGTEGFTSPPKEGVLMIFFSLKNPTASAGLEPANLGTKGQHATPRPPKWLELSLGYQTVQLMLCRGIMAVCSIISIKGINAF
jgi:hypothetical protein